ncbi:MAG: hypothetical protein OXR73_25510, partial [Myxococcales bacterium]|nr:hypothetical protein [Myxococcales bacterium]
GGWLVRQDYSDPGRVSLLRDADASGAIVYDATVGDRDIIGGLHRSTGDVETYLNGSPAGTDSKAQVSWDQYFLGGRESAGYGVPMKLHELIVVSGALSAAERESLEGYLAHKWGVSSDLPAVHPEKSRSGASRLLVEDTSVGGNVADRVACAGAADGYTLDVPAVPGMDYYVVVKGQGAADRGLYDLSLTDIGAVSDEGCGVDPTSADAFYEFQIADAGGRDIHVDVTGSAVATPAFALFRDDGTLGDRSDDTNIGCATNSQTFADLPAGTYYVVAKSTTTENGEADKAIEVSIQDADGLGSLACDSGDSSNAGRITRTLPAGTYYVGVTGLGAGVTRTGTYELTFRDTATSGSTSGATWVDCAQGTTLDANVTAGNTYYVVVKGDLAADAGPYSLAVTDIADATTEGHGVTDIGCGTDATTPDAYFEFDVADVSGRNVTVDLTGTSYPGAFQLYRDAGVVDDRSDDVPVGTCQPFGHGGDVPASFSLAQGKYYLALRGDSAAGGGGVGPYDVQIRDDDDYGSIVCADGLSGSGAYLTRVLQPGDYWVGLTGQTGASGNYQVTFRDTAVPVATGATPVACSDSMISASVDAGSTYYVVVKGLNDADQGDYALSVADATGAASFGCNDDTVAGDAFFEFRVDDPDGRDVTIDTEGSALDTVVAIFPANASSFDAGSVVACDADSGSDGNASLINVHLDPGTYYAIVRAEQGAADAQLPFELSIRDDRTGTSVFCDQDDVAGKASITQLLQPGTYHAVLSGKPAVNAGAYRIRFRDQTPFDNAAQEVACNDAADELIYDVDADTPYYVSIKGATAGAEGAYRLTLDNFQVTGGMGCGADPASPDAFYKFDVSTTTRVNVNTNGTTADTVIAIYEDDETYFGTNYALDAYGAGTFCDNDGGSTAGASSITADLSPGSYYAVVKAENGSLASMPFELSVKDENANAAIDCATAIDPRIQRTLPPGDYSLVVSNDNTAGGAYNISFQDAAGSVGAAVQVACNDLNDEIVYPVEANTPYYVMVKGSTDSDVGAYGLVVESNDNSTSAMGCGADADSP